MCNYQLLTIRVKLLPLLQCRTQCFTCCLTLLRPKVANFNPQEGHVILKYLLEGRTSVYRLRQKYLTILQNSCDWNRWRGEFVLERSSSETQKHFSGHGALVCRASGFCYGDVFQKQRLCLDSEDISSAIQYSSERVSLVAIILLLRISQEQGVQKETKDNGGFETEHQGRSGSNFSQHAARSDAYLPETLAGMC